MLVGMKKDRIGLNRVDSAPIVSNRIESARFGSTRITFTRKRARVSIKIQKFLSHSKTIFFKYIRSEFPSPIHG